MFQKARTFSNYIFGILSSSAPLYCFVFVSCYTFTFLVVSCMFFTLHIFCCKYFLWGSCWISVSCPLAISILYFIVVLIYCLDFILSLMTCSPLSVSWLLILIVAVLFFWAHQIGLKLWLVFCLGMRLSNHHSVLHLK